LISFPQWENTDLTFHTNALLISFSTLFHPDKHPAFLI
jgi:hypothetical protein